ncbi:MAG TPA: phosphatidate cytidylyltransferase [Candidatus Deferrimicrobium sp.]|nr:phosphatidate cytidylyltransferase [Candidatus Deferrimicrobium sp.]
MFATLAVPVGSLFAAGALLIAATHLVHRTDAPHRRQDWAKYGVYLILIAGFLLAACTSRTALSVLIGLVILGGTIEFGRNLKSRSAHTVAITALLALLLTLSLGHLVVGRSEAWESTVCFLFVSVGIADSFAQLWGKLFGRHKLCPRVSPGKTWEGLIGGVLSTVAGALTMRPLMAGYSLPALLFLAIVIAGSAVGGDLLFSFIKRQLGIKDFSAVLAGHGGLLDRFDSLVVSAPAFFWASRMCT